MSVARPALPRHGHGGAGRCTVQPMHTPIPDDASRGAARRRPAALPGLLTLASLLALSLLPGACAPRDEAPPQQGSLPRSRLLTAAQYHNSIADVFGADIAASVLSPMPPMARTAGLRASGAAFAGLTADQMALIQRAAASIADKATDERHRSTLVPCRPEGADRAACTRDYLARVGRLLYRRPLDPAQLDALAAVAGDAAARLDDYHAGLALALESMLISPQFLFISDRAEDAPAQAGQRRLDAWSLASRLSFLLWNAPPDATLLDAAASGALHSPDGLARSVDRMLRSDRLEHGVRAFFDDMLGFEIFDSLAKDPAVYPMVTGSTLEQAREQTLRTIVDHLLQRQGDYRDLFTTRRTFMSPALAVIYGVPAAPGWVPHEFDPDSRRRGLLTQVSFLAAHSHAVRSSPTLRGKALRESFLCQQVPEPPPNVDFSALEENAHARTARERLAAHNRNPSCAGCHLIMDPMGLALEHFDGAGRFRASENGAALDVSGELDGAAFSDVDGLARALREHPKLSACLVRRIYAYGTGGPLAAPADRAAAGWLARRFRGAGYRLPALLRDLSLSPAFRRLRTPRDDAALAAARAGAPARISAAMLALEDSREGS